LACRVEARLSYLLWRWLETAASRQQDLFQARPVHLRHDPDTTVGIDVVYLPVK